MALSRSRLSRKALVIVSAAVAVLGSVAAAASASPSSPNGTTSGTGNTAFRPSQATAAPPEIIPKPASMTVGTGAFALEPGASIVAASPGAFGVAEDLAAYLRPATGFGLRVVGGRARPGDIVLRLGGAPDPTGEAYQLTTTTSSVTLQSATAHGLYDGVQTIRQLLPAWINSPTVQHVDWTMPVVQIADAPRYTYRGVMLDIARHYETPDAVKALIDQAAAYKINTFHLHLSDDQGFRLVINGFPNLTNIGGAGSVGSNGRTEDPGGFWTQAQYKDVVAYAAAHFMQLIPEVDSPGHNNAIIMSEFNDTSNPQLSNPSDINCSTNNPPQWDYSEDVGYSALCPESANTWTIMTAIIDQLTSLSTTSSIYDLGGDEVPATVLSQDRYAAFLNKEGPIVNGDGKTVMGWADIAGPGTQLAPGSIAEYWEPSSGSDPGTITGTEAVAKNMKIVMAPANHTYLDQKYVVAKSGNEPPVLGLDWACPTGCDVDAAYNWDPATFVTGVTDQNVIGVEGAMWGETVTDESDFDYMVFPRLPALAEIAWSPQVDRSSKTSPAYLDFVTRLGAQGARWQAAGQNFYPSTEVAWDLAMAPARPTVAGNEVSGTLATLSAPGDVVQPGGTSDGLTATVDWGDGTTTPAILSGTAATPSTVNGLYSVTSDHTYASHGTHDVTITASAPGVASTTVQLTVRS